MPGVSRVGVDSAGGTITGPGVPSVVVNGAAASVKGDAVAPHGDNPHASATMVGSSSTVIAGGKGVVRDHVFDEAKKWMKLNGATKAQCWARGTLVQMYEKMGMENTHQVMRIKL